MTCIWSWSATAADNDDADDGLTQAEGMAAALVNNSARMMMARTRALLDLMGGATTQGGSSNAYTITSTSGHAITAYVDGMLVTLRANHTCTGATTVNIDTVGAADIKKGAAIATASGDIVSGAAYLLQYNASAGDFYVLGPLAAAAFQPLDATLTAFGGLTIADGKVPYGTGTDAFSTADSTSYGRALLNVADEAALKALINAEVGTDVQAYDAQLAAIAGTTPTSGDIFYWTDATTVTVVNSTDKGRSILSAATYAAMRALLDVEAGTDYYSISATDSAIAAVISDTAYDASSWNGVTGVAPSKNAVRDQVETLLKQGRTTIPIMAGAMIAATTNGPSSGQTETSSNKVNFATKDFDTSTQEFCAFAIPMPKNYNNGTVTFEALWTAASGSGGVAWALQGVALSDDDATDTAYGTEQVVTDTLITAGDVHRTSESSAITIAGSPAAGDVVFFRVKRVPSNGSDTLGVDAKLIGIRIFYTTNAADDT